MPGRTVVPLLVAVALALGGAACGGESDEQQIEDAIGSLQKEFAAGDVGGTCELLTEDAKRHLGTLGHGPPKPCREGLRMISESVNDAGRRTPKVTPPISKVTVDGDHATAVLAAKGVTLRVPLVRENDDWKVDALFGGIPAGLQRDKY